MTKTLFPPRRLLVDRDFIPCSGPQLSPFGDVQYRRGRHVTPLRSSALRHWLDAVGPSSDCRVGQVILAGKTAPGPDS